MKRADSFVVASCMVLSEQHLNLHNQPKESQAIARRRRPGEAALSAGSHRLCRQPGLQLKKTVARFCKPNVAPGGSIVRRVWQVRSQLPDSSGSPDRGAPQQGRTPVV